MPHDIYAIDPAGTQFAGDELHRIARPLRDAAVDVTGLDRRGADLAPTTTSLTTLLDEIASEVELLGDVFLLRAELSALADQTFTEPGAFDALYARFDLATAGLRRSIDDEIGGEPADYEPNHSWTAREDATWWASLSDGQRAHLTFTESEAVGNTDGIPAHVRYLANRITIQELVDAGSDDERLVQFVDPATGRVDVDRQIIVFDPSGDGVVAEVFGDLGTARSIGIVVPGMGSELGNFDKVRSDAAALRGLDPDVATIAWSGYDAPKGLSTDVSDSFTGLWEVARDDMAQTGAGQLVRFSDGIRLDTAEGSTLTVIGHSYGSLVTGHAVQQGLNAERIVFIGSPGVGVDNVGEFDNPHVEEFFAGDVHGDPVADLKRFGDAPTDPDFGATVFDAGDPDSIGLGRHSEYFDEGTAIDNLQTIVTGGKPTEASVPLINYVTEPFSDLDIPVFPGDDVPTGWLDTAGAHGQDAVEAGADWVGDQVGDAVDGITNLGSDIADGAEELRDRLTPDISWFRD